TPIRNSDNTGVGMRIRAFLLSASETNACARSSTRSSAAFVSGCVRPVLFGARIWIRMLLSTNNLKSASQVPGYSMRVFHVRPFQTTNRLKPGNHITYLGGIQLLE